MNVAAVVWPLQQQRHAARAACSTNNQAGGFCPNMPLACMHNRMPAKEVS
jgi:hypothetical protein